ncbi:MAG TPA: hypothetical protein VGB26_05395 [Nitrospiria bacterium]|jgi:hypothetical protein
MKNQSIRWTEEEIAALQITRIFQIKGEIQRKVWSHLELLQDALREEIENHTLLAPEGIDTQTGQIAKGENHMRLPFVYLDFPKFFSREEKCTFRTFFWWGNSVVYALILEGKFLLQYKKRIKENYNTLIKGNFHLAITKDPWEWRKGNPHTVPLKKNNKKEFLHYLEEKSFIKLERFLELKEPAFKEGRILKEGIATFRLLTPILFK